MAPRLFLGKNPNTLHFNCLIEGDAWPVVVSIDRDQTIGMLKNEIHNGRKTVLAAVDPIDLMLFKVRNGSGTQQ